MGRTSLNTVPTIEGEGRGGGSGVGGVVDFHEHVWSLVSLLVEKTMGIVFHGMRMISVDSKQLEKS